MKRGGPVRGFPFLRVGRSGPPGRGDTIACARCSHRYAGGEQPLALDVESFYERYGPMVLRRCRALLRNDAKAQDSMQDVFVALIRHQDRLGDEAPSALLL